MKYYRYLMKIMVYVLMFSMCALAGCGKTGEPVVNIPQIVTLMPEPTMTSEATATPELTVTTTLEPTITPTATLTPRPTSTATPTPTTKPTSTVAPTPTTKPTSTVAPTPTTKLTSTATPTPTTKPTSTVAPTPTTKPTSTVTPTPTTKPTSTVTPIPTPTPVLAEGEVLLCEQKFPDAAFRSLLSELVDLDENGILTLEEREAFTELYNNTYDSSLELLYGEVEAYYEFSARNDYEKAMFYWANRMSSLEGIQYFPKLQYINLRAAKKAVDFDGEDVSDFHSVDELTIENMPELKNVQIVSPTLKTIRIKNAKALKYLLLNSGQNDCNMVIDKESLEQLQFFGCYLPVSLNLNGVNNLECLGVSKCSEVVIEQCTKLKKLSVSNCSKLTIQDCNELNFIYIWTNVFLERLDLSTCASVKKVYFPGKDYFSEKYRNSAIQEYEFASTDVEVAEAAYMDWRPNEE